MKIIIETIPHDQQRYPTCGDWYFKAIAEDGSEIDLHPEAPIRTLINAGKIVLYIKVSKVSDWKHSALVAVHELAEVMLCINDGVSQEEVDKFDFDYEENRAEGDESEPGDSIQAPYRTQHCFATAIERMLCAAFGLSWLEYENEISALFESPAEKPAEAPPGGWPPTVQPLVPEVGGCPPPPVEPGPPEAA